ncbi:DUF4148 domain-containing protein [Achromobacter arsenitoxydans]|uniref:DUF4148 domain-containing protein n=1 Tax=Achromobacter arsenitoxydans SY8 TaxID=477184 RepID=H0F553_9BURK|nr:DUF4148 domain-containing protein [Achromobacter arsenitoxydans]EHK66632.1 hypothetical protein KYC_09475 [Achromobacter arsenitoxydans SY8]
MNPVLPFRALIPVALAAFALLSGPAVAQTAATVPATAAPPTNVTLTRADVERDLAAWKEAGVENQWSGDDVPDPGNSQYAANYNKYVSTRPASMAQPWNQMPAGYQSQPASGSQGKW